RHCVGHHGCGRDHIHHPGPGPGARPERGDPWPDHCWLWQQRRRSGHQRDCGADGLPDDGALRVLQRADAVAAARRRCRRLRKHWAGRSVARPAGDSDNIADGGCRRGVPGHQHAHLPGGNPTPEFPHDPGHWRFGVSRVSGRYGGKRVHRVV
ncbi:hypothetical protein H4R19_007210, partial [Coemansia spiralis]